ncbi:hypothetical protein [Rhodohalobacter mucosus]|uniref:Outer membrane protein beta-barrel domain-containing protein n=1 Tax=Rhodohalobacter mucosus TaxID=2079485 RepID=A0A316TUR4_9BACT|nr:hypothetical protein [Rhodohalobacter mucosus]PWN08190.1 hypothetical protein DDZ15_00720 [Rhodohalobacter mucosus]
MKTLLILFTLCVSVTGVLSGQQREAGTDVIYLKNGSVIRGEILEIKENGHIRIRYSNSDELLIMVNDILRVNRDRVSTGLHYNTSGYMNRSGFEILSGTGGNTFRFASIHGLHFNPHLSAGLGIGLTPYNDPLNLIPFFADVNYRLLKANTSPYIYLKAGYNFTMKNENEDTAALNRHTGGLLINPGAGIDFNFASGFGWYIQAGYNIDQSSFEFDGWGTEVVRTDLTYRRISVGMGFTF